MADSARTREQLANLYQQARNKDFDDQSWREFLLSIPLTTEMTTAIAAAVTSQNARANASFSTGTTTTTFAAGQLSGSKFVVYTNTQGTPGSIATRTATEMFGDDATAVAGNSYVLRIVNGQGSGTLTVTAGDGVTLTGTMTIAANTYRDFIVTYTTATALVIQNIGIGTFS
jgi:hypothetical protein